MGSGAGTGTPVSGQRYVTLAAMKTRLGITDTTDDGTLGDVLDAVSREIDKACSRHFYQASATRYFQAEDGELCFVDDLVSVTTLDTDDGSRTYGTSWAATDYDLCPDNAAGRGAPYLWLEVTPVGTRCFPTVRRGVRLVGVYGWPAVPDDVAEACAIQAGRLFKRKDAPFGVVGSAEMGQMLVIPKLDPDVMLLLRGYVRMHAGGV